VHVYRSEAGGSWVRLTATPLKRGGIPVPQAVVQGDSTMQAFVEAAQTATVGDMQGVIGAMMMVKAVQSNHYARFLGLCHIDGDVTSGVSYRYRVTQVQPGRETTVGETGSVVAGRYEPVAPPEGLAAEAGDTEAAIRWTPEPERFFGVNVYRRSNRDTVTVRANSDMILISAQAGADGKQKYPDVFFTDKNLNNSYRYTYYLRSIDYLGREGLPSAPVTIAPHDMTPPEPPRSVAVAVSGLLVSLTWENPAPSPIWKDNTYIAAEGVTAAMYAPAARCSTAANRPCSLRL
jgi:hypothetical protein